MVDLRENNDPGARIKVIGTGGCGGNAIDHMIASGLNNIDFISVNTDAQALQKNTATIRLQIGQLLTRGRGTGGIAEIGRKAALALPFGEVPRNSTCLTLVTFFSS